MTARDLIKGSLRLIGAIATGENPSADEQADALSVLNDMLGSWSTDNLLIPAIVREEFAMVVGQASRTLGVGGNFNTSRPVAIERATIENLSSTPNVEAQIDLLTTEQWANVISKDQSGEPQGIFIQWNNPLLIINFDRIPSTANNLVLYSQKPLSSIANASATIDMAPGYAKALRYNLAVELAPEYGKAAAPEIVAGAMESKAGIKRANIKANYLTCDAALVANAGFNIFTGV